MDAIPRILAKLEEVRRRDLTCFGSGSHGYRLNPPLDEAAVRTFERQHGVRLPEDYRSFLLRVGNGGAGPHYGVLPLEQWNDAAHTKSPDFLVRPCPLRPDLPGNVPLEKVLNCSWQELFQGTLALVHQGCSYYALLVVTGSCRGRVLYMNQEHTEGVYFVHHRDFLSWYERWLDELLWGYDDFWFGYGLPGREEDLVSVLRDADATPELRSEAMATLCRIATLGDDTLAAVRAQIRDTHPRIRVQVASLLAKHRVADATDDIMALLEDAEPSVRRAALSSLAELPGTTWESAARVALADTSVDVLKNALFLLEEAKAVQPGDVEPLFGSPDADIRRHAVYAVDAIAGQAIEIPRQLLQDPDPYVRRAAIPRYARPSDRAKVPVLIALAREELDPDVLCYFVWALRETGGREAVPFLIEMSRHPEAYVRQVAAVALGNLGDRRAIPALEALLSDETKPVRRHGQAGSCSGRTVAEEARAALDRLSPTTERADSAHPSG